MKFLALAASLLAYNSMSFQFSWTALFWFVGGILFVCFDKGIEVFEHTQRFYHRDQPKRRK